MRLEHAPAANHVAGLRVTRAVEAAAELVSLLEYDDVVAAHAAIADQQRSRRETRDAATDDVGACHGRT